MGAWSDFLTVPCVEPGKNGSRPDCGSLRNSDLTKATWLVGLISGAGAPATLPDGALPAAGEAEAGFSELHPVNARESKTPVRVERSRPREGSRVANSRRERPVQRQCRQAR